MLVEQKESMGASSARRALFSPCIDARFAIYCAPNVNSAWWKFGSAWLGRDAISSDSTAHRNHGELDSQFIHRITATPRRYGFHATLKAPFQLSAGRVAQHVYLQAETLAASLRPVRLPPPRLQVIDGFVALGFDREDAASRAASAAANAIAAQCVSCFDNLRARPDAVEIARRQAAGLSARQACLLAQWGYPFVFDEFRLHFTLTERLNPADQERVIDALSPAVAALGAEPFMLDALSIYLQPSPAEPFVAVRRYGFDGSLEIYGNG